MKDTYKSKGGIYYKSDNSGDGYCIALAQTLKNNKSYHAFGFASSERKATAIAIRGCRAQLRYIT